MTVSLPPEIEARVRAHVESGEYSSPADVISAAIQLFDQVALERQQQHARLREMVQLGVDQLDRGEFHDGEEMFAEILADLDRVEASTS